MKILYPIHAYGFDQSEDGDFAISGDAEPFILDFGIDENMFWDEIDWLWDCAEIWSGDMVLEDDVTNERMH